MQLNRIGTMTSAVSGCQEFSQNAWKKDLCSNCYKPRSDHCSSVDEEGTDPEVRPSPSPSAPCWCEPPRGISASYKYELNRVIGNSNNNNINNNNNNNNSTFVNNNRNNEIDKSKKTIGSNGVLLWEIGHNLTDDKSPKTSSDGGDQSKLPKRQQVATNGHCNGVQSSRPILRSGTDTSQCPTARVGFLEGSPQVIGYGGGDDYDDWDSDKSGGSGEDVDVDDDDDDEPSDLDSLEGFPLSEEDKAFTQLTDQNTEFNAYNGNLLTDEIRCPVLSDETTTTPTPPTDPLYAMPTKSTVKMQQSATITTVDEDDGTSGQAPPPPPLSLPPTMSSYAASSSANAKEFIVSNLYSTSPASASDTDDFLDAEDFPVESSNAPTDKDHHHHHRPTAPITDGRGHKTSQQIPKAGFQSVPVRLSSNQRQSVQDLFKEEPVTAAERRAAFKNSLPIPSKILMRNGTTTTTPSNYSRPRVAPQIPSSLPPDSDDKSQRLPIQSKTKTNQESGNRSCHYASSYVTTGGHRQEPDKLRTTAVGPARGGILPDTPLTNPYSSTALRMKQPSSDKPPATKPKPKLPAKPSMVIARRSQGTSQPCVDDKDGRKSFEDAKKRIVDRTSALYQEIDENVPTKTSAAGTPDTTPDINSSFESRSGVAIDGNRRMPKRRAPKPPSTDPPDTVADASESEDSLVRNTRSCSMTNLKDSPTPPPPTTTPIRQSPPKISVLGRSQTLNNRASNSSLDSYCSKGDGGDDQGTPSSFKDAKLKKSRFSLKKLLKFGGSSKDDDAAAKPKSNGIGDRREKLQILHPIDLMTNGKTGGQETSDVTTIEERQQTVSPEVSSKDKPPLPRRFRTPPDRDEQPIGGREKPVRPPPPVKQVLRRNNKSSFENSERSPSPTRNSEADDGIRAESDKRNSIYDSSMEYANLGDVRNSVTPKKPGRCTSSMTDITTDSPDGRIRQSASQTSLQNYAYSGHQCHANAEMATYYSSPNEEDWPTETDDDDADADAADLYADQSAIPDSNDQSSQSSSFTSEVLTAIDRRRPSSNSSDQPFRVVGLLSSPKTSTPVPDIGDADARTGRAATDVDRSRKKSGSRLSLRKARSIVHKSLEDNYGAVVSANHQTLTQILDQVSQCQPANTSSTLKVLDDVPLRWSAFTVVEDSRVTVVGDVAFYAAVWLQNNIEVTLMVSPEPLNATSRNPCVLTPVAEFQDDHIPWDYVLGDRRHAFESKRHRATVWVIDRMRVETLTSVSEHLHSMAQSDIESYERDSCFVLLQLINGLKHLQAQGIEQVDGSLEDFLLVTKTKDTNYRLLLMQSTSGSCRIDNGGGDDGLSLCQCALKAMLLLLCARNDPSSDERLEFLSAKPAFRLIGDILLQERATSLSRAKLLLEYMIWGPSDELDGDADDDDGGVSQEQAYHRWLDLERATVLNNLIRTQSLWQIRLTVFEECMLSFLVRICAKTLRDAANQLRKAESMSVPVPN